MTVVSFPARTFEAKPVRIVSEDGFIFRMSGLLEGGLDFAVETSQGSLTYPITVADAEAIITGLRTVCDDVEANCLYDTDSLLER